MRFAPIVDGPSAGHVEPATLAAASAPQHMQDGKWRRVWNQAQQRSALRVSVLGGSVACGAGAAFPSSSTPDLGLSWVRRMADALEAELEGTRVTVDLACKGGVTPDYFAMCSESNLGAADVVLLDFEPNMDMDENHGQPISIYNLRLLLKEVGRALPMAPVAFVGWPSFKQWLVELDGRPMEALEEMERRLKTVALRADGVDGLFASRLLARRAQGAGNATRRLQQIRDTYYADRTHPRQMGHDLLGVAAAQFVASRMRQTGCDPSLATLAAPSRHGSKDRRSWCYQRADELPVAAAGGWELVNEGGAQARGTRKLGYLSRQVTQSLVLGPLVPELRCATLAVSLGVLQSWRRHQGVLRVDCSGCRCIGGNEKWRHREDLQTTRFPLVQTYSRLLPEATVTLPNATVTVQTRFFVVKDEHPCFINLTHVTSPAREQAGPMASSRVRVDNLALQEPQCGSVCRLALRGNRAQREAGLHAKACAQRREASGACWNLPGQLAFQKGLPSGACRLEEDVYVYSSRRKKPVQEGFKQPQVRAKQLVKHRHMVNNRRIRSAPHCLDSCHEHRS